MGVMLLIGILGTGLLADVPAAATRNAAEGEPAVTAIFRAVRTGTGNAFRVQDENDQIELDGALQVLKYALRIINKFQVIGQKE